MKSGNIVLIGPTNSGKSTLVNSIMGRRVTLVSRKKQSTTFNQKLIKNISEFEYILQDTPGTFASMKKISNKVVSSPFAEIDNAVIIYLVLDISKKTKTELSTIVAEILAKEAKEKKITKVYFDRGIYKYHGRVKIFAEALRKNGMEF